MPVRSGAGRNGRVRTRETKGVAVIVLMVPAAVALAGCGVVSRDSSAALVLGPTPSARPGAPAGLSDGSRTFDTRPAEQ